MDLELKGQAVLVTGAGSGIGQAIALAFAAEGAAVAVNDLTRERCQETLELLRPTGVPAMAAPFDVTRLDDVRASIGEVHDRFGRLDVLVNNAAIMVNNTPFVESRPEDCEREIAVGLFGAMHCTRSVLQGMIGRTHGRIVNIVSDAARVGQEKEVAYSSAKGGLISFTKSLAREVGRHGVTVNAVSPAATDTPLRREMLGRLEAKLGAEAVAAREEKVRRVYPVRRIGQPNDVADLVTFLASTRARHITGQICSVNGGFAMPG
ncbi:glucose 1-dehydrogenase [Hyphomicrobium sp. CS1BSMeth3]|uniref:SDR family NAD(P)-dependent oxidoreductase n=1 Tax=Hyphomicrobium sp. CS1BSMeth3 TaxID=1892844 RepID=UPI0009FB6425|nr:glucose 1-dehydrogenase [Hyphomicrobium sp. CS1BSMeth3]